jgi:hypothetical protein
MNRRENLMLLTGGALALSGLFLIVLEYNPVATLLFFVGVLIVAGVLGERICPLCVFLNVIRRIFDKESVEQNTCPIQIESSVSIDRDSSD